MRDLPELANSKPFKLVGFSPGGDEFLAIVDDNDQVWRIIRFTDGEWSRFSRIPSA